MVGTVIGSGIFLVPGAALRQAGGHAGPALLVWIGIKLVAEEEGGEPDVEASERLIAAVKTVIVADLVMSLDNVIGVAAAVALFRYKVGVIPVILACAGAGLVFTLIRGA